MTVTDVRKDPDALTLTITASFSAGIERVWQIWADPRQLERWWGPPTYPATVVEHDLRPGGRITYFMTGPEGDEHHGWWRVRSVTAPHGLEFEDGFADDDGAPNPSLPVTITHVTLRAVSADDGAAAVTEMLIVTTFPSVDALEQLVTMGMIEGMTAAMGQIPSVLAS